MCSHGVVGGRASACQPCPAHWSAAAQLCRAARPATGRSGVPGRRRRRRRRPPLRAGAPRGRSPSRTPGCSPLWQLSCTLQRRLSMHRCYTSPLPPPGRSPGRAAQHPPRPHHPPTLPCCCCPAGCGSTRWSTPTTAATCCCPTSSTTTTSMCVGRSTWLAGHGLGWLAGWLAARAGHLAGWLLRARAAGLVQRVSSCGSSPAPAH